MNENEIARIAAAVNQLRPDWPIASLRTLLAGPRMVNRPRRDVAVALAWVACEAESKTPARVMEHGPWWQAAAMDGQNYVPANRGPHCGRCGFDRQGCEARSNGDHKFEGPDDWMRRRMTTTQLAASKAANDARIALHAAKANSEPPADETRTA